jgi:hypothetical protein
MNPERLRVYQERGTGGGIPQVAEGYIPFETVQDLLVKDIRNKTHGLVFPHTLPV